jgi:CHAT domain-containing protein
MSHNIQPTLPLQPIISYPRQAQVGETYLMTIDLEPTAEKWPYEEEEYSIYCMINTNRLFISQPADEPVIVLHRFGGTYGQAKFLLTAKQEVTEGSIKVTLVTERGMPIKVFDLKDIQISVEESSDKIKNADQLIVVRTHSGSISTTSTEKPWVDKPKDAITFYKQAIKRIPRKIMPMEWAKAIAALGDAYLEQYQDKRKNIEQAIACYQQALEVVTIENAPSEWARITSNLAHAYLERIDGRSHAENIEKVIELYQQVLRIKTFEDNPVEWAQTMNNLAIAYSNRIHGTRADNLEKAIEGYQAALQVRTRKPMPVEWATTMNNLAIAYSNRIHGTRADNLEKAIEGYQAALQVITRKPMPVEWATTRNNLAIAYSNRIYGTRADNLEKAIEAYQAVLQVRTQKDMPVEWAETINNLANTYSDRIRGMRVDNLEKAIEYYQAALQIRTHEAMPIDWATTMNNLANAYRVRIRGTRADNLEKAIDGYQAALQVRTQKDMPVDWAETMNNLALAYSNRIHGTRADNLEKAIEAYQAVLQVRTQKDMPVEWAETMNNLALAYSNRIHGKRAENIERAIECYQAALQVRSRETLPHHYLHTQYLLGNLYFNENHRQDAYIAYASALETTETLFTDDEGTVEGRQAELSETQYLTARVGYCLAKLGRFDEAIVCIEQAKTRTFSETYNTTLLKMASEIDQQAFAESSEQVKALEKEMYSVSQENTRSREEVLADLKAARTYLSSIVKTLRQAVPNFMPEGIDFQSICQLASTLKQPLVYLLTTPKGSLALIVLPNTSTMSEEQAIWLDDFNTEELNGLLYDTDEKRGYLHGIVLADFQVLYSILTETILPQLSQQLIIPLMTRLKELGHSQVVLIPMDTLNLLPLHACTNFTFSFAPSARLLQSALNKTQPYVDMPPSLLGIGSPTNQTMPVLKYSSVEIANIAALFPHQQQLCENAATRKIVLSTIHEKTHIHFSCHSMFNQHEPLDSALYLAGNDRLTVQDLILGKVDLTRVRMVVLSACQTGIIDFTKIPNEAIGFSGAFMQAGVPAIISTLWPVEEIASLLLLQRFYQLYLQKHQPPVYALQQAQYWLRDATVEELGLVAFYQKIFLESKQKDADAFRSMRAYKMRLQDKPFAHPYYWAGFVFYGV